MMSFQAGTTRCCCGNSTGSAVASARSVRVRLRGICACRCATARWIAVLASIRAFDAVPSSLSSSVTGTVAFSTL